MVTACKTPEYRLQRMEELLKSSRGVAENRRLEIDFLRKLIGKVVIHFDEVGGVIGNCGVCVELRERMKKEAGDYAITSKTKSSGQD